jgi:hypothetical protein
MLPGMKHPLIYRPRSSEMSTHLHVKSPFTISEMPIGADCVALGSDMVRIRGFWPDVLIGVSRRDIASAFEICPVDWDAAFFLPRWAIRNTNGRLS